MFELAALLASEALPQGGDEEGEGEMLPSGTLQGQAAHLPSLPA